MSRTTLMDVAARAGVSVKTVSRVVNDEPNVSAQTMAAVKAAIAELAFVPNVAARRLSSGRALAIGLISGWRVSSPYSTALIDRVFLEANRRDYALQLFASAEGLEKHVIDALVGRQVDGFILDTKAADSDELMSRLDANEVPHVVIHPHKKRAGSRASYIQINDKGSAQRVVETLIGLGHRTIGCISFGSPVLPQLARVNGYTAALNDAGLAARPDLAATFSGDGFLVGYLCALDLLAIHKDMTAIFASTDEIARGVISAAWHLGRRVPDDLSVAGFDGIVGALQLTPRLTTVHQPINDIAALAVEHLIDGIQTHTLRHIDTVLPTQLVMGASTGHHPV